MARLRCKCTGLEYGCEHGNPCNDPTARSHPLFCDTCTEARVTSTLEWVAQLKKVQEVARKERRGC